MKKQIPPFGLRMSPELREWLAARAAENSRSMNGEVLSILKAMQKADGKEAASQ